MKTNRFIQCGVGNNWPGSSRIDKGVTITASAWMCTAPMPPLCSVTPPRSRTPRELPSNTPLFRNRAKMYCHSPSPDFPVATPKADILPVEGQNFGLANGWQVALIKQACKY